MAAYNPNKLKAQLGAAVHNFPSGTYKAMLVTTGFVWAQTDGLVSAFTGGTNYELNASNAFPTGNYAAGFSGSGRKTLTSKSITQDDTNNKGIWIAANITWTAILAGDVIGVLIYLQPGGATTDADNLILSYHTLGSTYSTDGGDFVAKIDPTNGFLQIS